MIAPGKMAFTQIPQHYPAGAPLDGDAINKVESISYPAFLKFLQDRSAKPLIIWVHGYRLSFPVSTAYCAQVARDCLRGKKMMA